MNFNIFLKGKFGSPVHQPKIKDDVINIDPDNLSRYNRSYQVFKNVRGTSIYYQESKKNLMALLRQNGCPSIFLTLSCAEFDWQELLKEIIETVYRKKVTSEYIDNLSEREKNRLISDNVVQSTLHFQKRVDKLFPLMQRDFFEGDQEVYHVSSYFYRIEFQQRGAPHVHSLLWLKNKKNEDAPNFWIDPSDQVLFPPKIAKLVSKTIIKTMKKKIKAKTKEVKVMKIMMKSKKKLRK